MRWTHIMIHHSLTRDGKTVSWNAIEDYHRKIRGWSDIGYHFGIELVNDRYQVLVGRPLDREGAHCREGNMNCQAIGICCVGNYDISPPSKEMLEILSYRLLLPLMNEYDISPENIVFHREYAGYKSCPGEMFDKTLLLEIINHAASV